MAFGQGSSGQEHQPLSEINMVPMIDVMLVLLIIFIVTAPMLTHSLKIELPQASSMPTVTEGRIIQLGIDAAGKVYWNGDVVSETELEARLRLAAKEKVRPELHLSIAKATRYEKVAALMAQASAQGLVNLAFITAPGSP